jgi:hypothetical protein
MEVTNRFDNEYLDQWLEGWVEKNAADYEACFGTGASKSSKASKASKGSTSSESGGKGKSKGDRRLTSDSRLRKLLRPESDNEQNKPEKRKLLASEVYNLIPGTSHYSYRGGLTTPPCSEVVNFIITDEALSISVKQMTYLGSLPLGYLDPETCEEATLVSPSGDNARPVQDLNGREVGYYCA